MDAFNYFKELLRLCNCYDCPECPLYNINFGKGCNIDQDATDDDIINLISSVENWAKEHPRKTRLQDFLEKHPKAPLTSYGQKIPKACAQDVGYCTSCKYLGNKCHQCWNESLEE